LALTCLGIWMIFDASYVYAMQTQKSGWKFVSQQGAVGVLGVAVMLALSHFDYRRLRKYAVLFFWVVVVLLAMTLAVGHVINHGKRWLGPSALAFQPSELAKLAIVLLIAHLCAGRPKLMRDFVAGPLLPILALGLLFRLVSVEPDLGTSLVIAGAAIGALFFSGVRLRHLLLVLVVGLVLVGGEIYSKSHGKNYQGGRISTFLHPDKDKTGAGYQPYNAMIAVGSGGVFGVGLGHGRQKYYIPEPHTDYIFATIAEEGGFLAVFVIISLYLVFVGRAMHIATLTDDPFGAILAGGIGAIFFSQIFLNLGVVCKLLPPTGVPLPFISYGGTSLLMSLVSVGILLSIQRFSASSETIGEKSVLAAERDFERKWSRSGLGIDRK